MTSMPASRSARAIDLGAAVVAIEAGLGHEHTDFALAGICVGLATKVGYNKGLR